MESVRLKYTGGRTGSFTISVVSGKALTKPYKFGNNHTHKYAEAHPADAALLETFSYIERVKRPATIPQNIPDIPRPTAANIDPKAGIDPQRAGQAARVDMVAMKAAVAERVIQEIETKEAMTITVKAAEIAAAAGINTNAIQGTGKDGKITVMDVRNAVTELQHA